MKAKQVLSDAFELELKDGLLEPVEFMDDVAIVTLVGDGMRTSRGVASQFFSSLAGSARGATRTYHWSVSSGSITTPERSP